MLKEAFRDDEASLTGGLLAWLRDQLPMSEGEAERLSGTEEMLRRLFAEKPDFLKALDILAAARKDALGDRKALLALPIEVRSLILRALGREEGTGADQKTARSKVAGTRRTRRRRK